MDVQNYESGHPSVSLWAYNITPVDIHLFLYERTTCGHGRPPVTIWTYNVAVDVHQLLYGPTTLHPWTSTSFNMDVQRAAVDVHQFL